MSAAAPVCFHCGEPLPPGAALGVVIDGLERRVCCSGCRAAAELICEAGLGDYYRYRTAAAPRPTAAGDDLWTAYDRPQVQAPLLGVEGDAQVVNLLLEGLSCAACSWLIDRRLAQLGGIVSARVNPATARARIVFRCQELGLGTLLRAIAALGYRPHVLGATDTLAVATRERRAALKRLAVAGLVMMQVMMFAVALYSGALDGMDPRIRDYLRIVSLVLTAPLLCYSGRPFFSSALSALATRHLGMDVPVAVALALAFAASAWNTLSGHGEVYFDSIVMFVFLLLTGRYLEMLARHRAASTAEALLRLVPPVARRLGPGGEERVPLASLAAGERVRVPLGECFPADGSVESATRSDESLLTGEALPVEKPAGAAVIAGALNSGAPVVMVLSAVGSATVLAGIVRLLERAQTERPRLALLGDRAAAWFVSRILIGAALVAVAWLLVDPARAFAATLAVLVATCPCALSLATPTALTAATGALARRGLLVTRADALEALAGADTVVFDKTGTLTCGQPRLVGVEPCGISATAARALAAALERASEHPLARAFESQQRLEAGAVEIVPGAGIEGHVAGQRLRIGTAAFVAALAGERPAQLADSGVHLGSAGGWLARFELADRLRPEALGVVRELAALGLEPVLASGDHALPVTKVAAELGIERQHARLRPEAKLALVAALSARGARVLAVGDGINDAPALRAATVSLALGTGSALAQSSADLVALSGDLSSLPLAVKVARRTTAVIRQNLLWAAAYNLLALPLAALGLVPPWLGALGMSLSSLLVVLNAARLARLPAPAAPCAPRPAAPALAAA